MAVKFLEDVGAKLINATRKEMVDAIFAASGRVVIGETVTFKQSMIDGVSNIELLKSWGCDMVTINHYNVNFPMIPGMESTQAGIEQFGSCFNEAGSKGCKPSTKVIENSFQKIFWQFGFGATIGDVKRLVGVPVGMTLEPVTEEDDSPQGRVANEENARRGAEQGASYITLIHTPQMSAGEFAKSVAQVRSGMGEMGLVKAGKMPWGGCSFLVNADEFVTEAEIKELAAAGADAIVLPTPGTVPGLTIELVRQWVTVVHNCGLLAETTIGTSQEGADPDVIRRFAIDSKMTGADLFQIGDSVYGGCCTPENVMSFARAIKGQRHTLRRAALSPLR